MDSSRLGRKQLPQHIMQNPPVGVILRLLRSINPHQRFELGGLSIANRANVHLASRGEFRNQRRNAGDFKYFLSGQSQMLSSFPVSKLQRKDPHPHEIGAMNTLVALRDYRAHS